jgi:hypothetical protein
MSLNNPGVAPRAGFLSSTSPKAAEKLCWIVAATLAILLAQAAGAASVASDNEGDTAYASGWTPGSSGGSGWGSGWTFRDQTNLVLTATDGTHGWFVANSTNNNNTAGDSNGDGDINSSNNKAWGLYSNAAGKDIYATRSFGGSLSIGQTFKFDMDNGNIAANQVVGMRLLTNPSDITSRDFEFRFVGGGTNYTLVDSAGTGNNTGIPFTREGLHVAFTLTSASTYSVSITSILTGQTVTDTGTLVSGSTPITGFAFKNQEAGLNSPADAYFNNIAVVPEPTALGLLGLGLLMMVARRNQKS